MKNIITLFLLLLSLYSCSSSSNSDESWESFSNKWKTATIQEKKKMIDVLKIYESFQSKNANHVMDIFGSPTFKGKNKFGQHEIRYDFDLVPETNFNTKQNLSFIIKNDVVIRVEAFIVPE